MWIEAVEGPRKMKPSFSADSEVGSEDSNFARSARAAREASRPRHWERHRKIGRLAAVRVGS
jgi:hypothetical protein